MSIETNISAIVIGGGISGLVALDHLRRQGVNALLIESEFTLGGKIKTLNMDLPQGHITVDLGPDSFVPNRDTTELIDSLKLQDRLIKPHKLSTGVMSKGVIRDLPNGFYFMLPTAAIPFITSPLISWKGKLRAGLELFMAKKKDDSDESIAQFVKRRFGDEMLQSLVRPFVKGIFGAEPEFQSVNATLPQFPSMERKYGSLIAGVVRSKRRSSPGFYTFGAGMDEIVSALYSRNSESIFVDTIMTELFIREDGRFKIKLSDNRRYLAKNLIFATPTSVSASYLDRVLPKSAELLSSMKQKKSKLLFFAYPRRKKTSAHTGLLFNQDLGVNSVSFSSLKFEKRAPQDILLVRASCSPEASELGVDQFIQRFSGSGPIWKHKIISDMPLYEVGHQERVKSLYASLPSEIQLCGNAYEGASIPDCITLAKKVAYSVMQNLK